MFFHHHLNELPAAVERLFPQRLGYLVNIEIIFIHLAKRLIILNAVLDAVRFLVNYLAAEKLPLVMHFRGAGHPLNIIDGLPETDGMFRFIKVNIGTVGLFDSFPGKTPSQCASAIFQSSSRSVLPEGFIW